jgi:hypothetical protein
VFFSNNKIAAGLSTAKTISRTALASCGKQPCGLLFSNCILNKALFSFEFYFVLGTVLFSFLFGKYYPIID